VIEGPASVTPTHLQVNPPAVARTDARTGRCVYIDSSRPDPAGANTSHTLGEAAMSDPVVENQESSQVSRTQTQTQSAWLVPCRVMMIVYYGYIACRVQQAVLAQPIGSVTAIGIRSPGRNHLAS
jgi:hypothetical protein